MKIFVSALIGAIILFVYQAMSWMVLGVHDHSFKYTENQDAIMECLNQNLDEEAQYFLPYFDKETTSQEEQQNLHQANMGKPWAMVTYHPKMDNNMGKNMGVGFVLCFMICLIISMVLINIPTAGFGMRMFLVMSLGALVMLGGPLYQANWFQTPSHNLSGELIDILLGYLLAGAWMSWWTGREWCDIGSNAENMKRKKLRTISNRFIALFTVVILVSGHLSSCSNQVSFDKQMMAAASELNKVCPMMVDGDTRLDNVVAMPNNTFQYNYTMVNFEKAELDLDDFRSALEPVVTNGVKTNPDLKLYRENQTTMAYSYTDKNGVFLFKIEVTADDYLNQPD